MSGDHEADNEWAFFGGTRRDAKVVTMADGGSREKVELSLTSTYIAGGVPEDAALRLFFKYNGYYHRYEAAEREENGTTDKILSILQQSWGVRTLQDRVVWTDLRSCNSTTEA